MTSTPLRSSTCLICGSPSAAIGEHQPLALGLARIDEVADELQVLVHGDRRQLLGARRSEERPDRVQRHRLSLHQQLALQLQRLGDVEAARVGGVGALAEGARGRRACLAGGRIRGVERQQQRRELESPAPVREPAVGRRLRGFFRTAARPPIACTVRSASSLTASGLIS